MGQGTNPLKKKYKDFYISVCMKQVLNLHLKMRFIPWAKLYS